MAYTKAVLNRARERLADENRKKHAEYESHLAAAYALRPRLREIEMAAMPHSKWYSTECAPLFIEQKGQQGEMIVAEIPELPAGDPNKTIGMGQYSVMPDGSGWPACPR